MWRDIPTEAIYTGLAAAGGAANYLHKFTHGAKFHVGLFIASMMLSGFSGLMFAYVGISMALPAPMLYVFSGMGGFMGHSALEFLATIVKDKIDKGTI